ncbi:hypothetical protein GF361_03410, partial [Candidatus Woesearchaeota archaeon]|nr:hypothetical protein [Candidatus Woesearchaeota archaeon]
MNKQLLIGLCMILLVIPIAHSVSTAYEISSVSRLVGDSPEDLINQLDSEELNFNHATYYGENGFFWFGSFEEKRDALKYLVGNSNTDYSGFWNYNDVDLSDFESNEIFIIEAENGYIENDEMTSHNSDTVINVNDVKRWKGDFADHNPLFIFDSNYAGLAIPKEDSFVRELTRYSNIIAPNFLDSREFVRAMICNLGDSKTLGNSFRDARNRYYANINPSGDELIGMTLMSYHLYGNPLTITTTPNYDKGDLERYCGKLVGEKEETPFQSMDFVVQDVSDNIQEIVSLDYAIESNNSFELLNVSDGENVFASYEIVRPMITKHHNLPLNAIVTNVSYVFSNPESLNLNLPEYDGELVNRTCAFGFEKNIEVTNTYKEDKQTVNLFISPLDVIDCENGDFKLYRRIEYTIDYVSPSPIYFDNIDYPAKILPSTDFNLTFNIDYVNNEVLDGEIEVWTEDKLVYQKEMISNVPAMMVSLTSEEDEKFTQYRIKYIEGNETLTESEFEIETRVLEYKITIPEIVKGDADVVLEIYNMRDTDVDIDVKDNLILNNTKIQGSFNNYLLNPGVNQFNYNYAGLLQSDQKYQLQFDLGYENKQEVLNDVIVTNHRPILAHISDITVKEGEIIRINVSAADLDDDTIIYSISDPVGSDGEWQTQIGDEGNYTVNVSASDTYSSDTSVVKIIVLPYNTAPVVDDINDIISFKGDPVWVTIYAEDVDGDNLTYFINDSRFNQTQDNVFVWEDAQLGDYTIEYSVSDGIETISGSFNVIVQNSNNNCTSSWNCTEWGDCVNDSRSRTCVDMNSCGFNDNRPVEQESCVSENGPEIYTIDGVNTNEEIVINVSAGEIALFDIVSNIDNITLGRYISNNSNVGFVGDTLVVDARSAEFPDCEGYSPASYGVANLEIPVMEVPVYSESGVITNIKDSVGIYDTQGNYDCSYSGTDWCYGYEYDSGYITAEVEIAGKWINEIGKSCKING